MHARRNRVATSTGSVVAVGSSLKSARVGRRTNQNTKQVGVRVNRSGPVCREGRKNPCRQWQGGFLVSRPEHTVPGTRRKETQGSFRVPAETQGAKGGGPDTRLRTSPGEEAQGSLEARARQQSDRRASSAPGVAQSLKVQSKTRVRLRGAQSAPKQEGRAAVGKAVPTKCLLDVSGPAGSSFGSVAVPRTSPPEKGNHKEHNQKPTKLKGAPSLGDFPTAVRNTVVDVGRGRTEGTATKEVLDAQEARGSRHRPQFCRKGHKLAAKHRGKGKAAQLVRVKESASGGVNLGTRTHGSTQGASGGLTDHPKSTVVKVHTSVDRGCPKSNVKNPQGHRGIEQARRGRTALKKAALGAHRGRVHSATSRKPPKLHRVEVSQNRRKTRRGAQASKDTKGDLKVHAVKTPANVSFSTTEKVPVVGTSKVHGPKQTVVKEAGVASRDAATQRSRDPREDPRPEATHGGRHDRPIGQRSNSDRPTGAIRLGNQGNAHVAPRGREPAQVQAALPESSQSFKEGQRQVAPVGWGPLVKTRGGARGLKDSSTELLSGDLKVCSRELGQTGAETVKGSEVSEASLPPTLPLRGPKLGLSGVRERGACRGGRGVTLNPRGKARDVVLHRKLPARQAVLSTLGRKGVGGSMET